MEANKNKRPRYQSFEVVYDEPTDALIDAPFRKTRPSKKGEIVADALFFGDSLMWGQDHRRSAGRYEVPWPRLLRERLASKGLRLVESSFIGRTTMFDDPEHKLCRSIDGKSVTGIRGKDFNGLYHFGTVFSSHSPRWVVVMLGMFDTQTRIRAMYDEGCTAKAIAERCMKIADKAREMFEGHCHEGQLKIMFIPPPVICCTDTAFEMGFDKASEKICFGFRQAFKHACLAKDVLFCDHSIYLTDSKDGVHFTTRQGKQLSELVWESMVPELPRHTKRPQRFPLVVDF